MPYISIVVETFILLLVVLYDYIISNGDITMVKTKCKRCDYTWEYKGKLLRRTCPNCGYNWVVRRGRPPKKR